jgi:hypothetical protein
MRKIGRRLKNYYPKRFWYKKPKKWRPQPMVKLHLLERGGVQDGEEKRMGDAKPDEIRF